LALAQESTILSKEERTLVQKVLKAKEEFMLLGSYIWRKYKRGKFNIEES
jgi:hypothetical protein